MKNYKIGIATLVLSSLILCFSCASNRAQKNSSLSDIIDKENILTILQWDVRDRTLFCIVASDTQKTEESTIPFERLSFYEKANHNLMKIHEFEEMSFLNMFHLYDGNLMTLWTSGSAVHVNIFTVDDQGKIKLVLQDGVKEMPEIVDVDSDGSTELLFSSGSVLQKSSNRVYPESTRVYRWDGNSYNLIKTVPWTTRFDALKGLKK